MNDMRQLTTLGRSIEDGSFAVIDAEVGPHAFTPAEWQIVRRVIHATADRGRRQRGEHLGLGVAAGVAHLHDAGDLARRRCAQQGDRGAHAGAAQRRDVGESGIREPRHTGGEEGRGHLRVAEGGLGDRRHADATGAQALHE